MTLLEPQSHTPGGRPCRGKKISPGCLHDRLIMSSKLDLPPDRAGESIYGAQKRGNSPGTKKRLAEKNALHYDLQRQRGIELREMIPDAFMKMAKSLQGSNRELMHTLNATKLYITSLLDDKLQLQEQVQKGKRQTINYDISHGFGDEVAESERASQSHTQSMHVNTQPRKRAVVGISPLASLSRVHGEHGAVTRCSKAGEEDGTFPMISVPDISPHDSFLRQAVERLIALTKESVMANQGVLDKKQADRLNAVHDCIVEMVEEISRG